MDNAKKTKKRKFRIFQLVKKDGKFIKDVHEQKHVGTMLYNQNVFNNLRSKTSYKPI